MLKLIRNLLQLPLQLILNRSVSEGNFQTKIYLEHPKEFRELSRCFNQMTEELAGIEMLRSDFINNFSHEFKTPMVSILGFSRLLKKGDLTAEEQKAMMILKEELEQGYLTEGGNIIFRWLDSRNDRTYGTLCALLCKTVTSYCKGAVGECCMSAIYCCKTQQLAIIYCRHTVIFRQPLYVQSTSLVSSAIYSKKSKSA